MIVVTGAGGQLGTAFRKVLPGARFLDRSHLDLADLTAIAPTLSAIGPSAIVNCAAYTAVDRAEDEEELALVVNGEAVGVMAGFAADRDIPFVTFSTDYVFAGNATEPYVESSPVDPVNAYGRTKLAGERAALDRHPGALVIRTSWVISGTHPNFVATMVRLAAERDLTVVDDQRGLPTVADDLAAGAEVALRTGATGILHLANQGETTWFGLARRAVEQAGLPPERIQPCATADYPTRAVRPAYSVLASERLDELGMEPLPPWSESLPAVVEAQLARG